MKPARYLVELRAGLTGFLSCVYIVVVTPALFAETGASPSAVMTSTIVISLLGSLGMGLYARAPFFLAPGLGMTVFFTYGMVVGMKIPLESALAVVFWSGVLLTVSSLFSLREKLVRLIPDSIQWAVSAGVGIFIAFVGLKNAGIIVARESSLVGPGEWTPQSTVFVLGLILGLWFLLRKNSMGFLPGILGTVLLAAFLGRFWGEGGPVVVYQGFFALPDFSLFLAPDLFQILEVPYAYLIPLCTLFLMVLTDTLSSFVGVSRVGGLVNRFGRSAVNPEKSFLVDAVTTALAGLVGVPPTTYLVESATGIQQGGRTGVTALTMGILLFPLLFFSPLLSMIPPVATAPTLVLTGFLMSSSMGRISWDKFEQAFPAFMVLILIPLTFSISVGLMGGVAAYAVCYLFRHREVRE